MRSLREAIVDLVSDLRSGVVHFPGKKEPFQTPYIEQLAGALVDFGRIRLNPRAPQGIFVDVNELALRLRETRRTVIAALILLETRGRAQRTKHKELWILQV